MNQYTTIFFEYVFVSRVDYEKELNFRRRSNRHINSIESYCCFDVNLIKVIQHGLPLKLCVYVNTMFSVCNFLFHKIERRLNI